MASLTKERVRQPEVCCNQELICLVFWLCLNISAKSLNISELCCLQLRHLQDEERVY